MRKRIIFFLMLTLMLVLPRVSAFAYAEEMMDPQAVADRQSDPAELQRASAVNLIGKVYTGYAPDCDQGLAEDPAKTTLAVYALEPGHSYALSLKGDDGTAIPVSPISVVFYDENMTWLAADENAEEFIYPEYLEAACAFITVDSDLPGMDRSLNDDDWMVHDVTAHGKIPVFHPAVLPEVLTPEFFGTPNDADNLQACFSEGGDIRLDGVYQTGSTVLRIERQSSVVAGPDSGIYTDGYNEAYYLPIIEVLAEDVRLEGLRLFSSADYKPYIDVRNNYVNELGRASNRIGISIWASRCHIYNLYGEYLGLIRLENADDCVFDGLHGQYIENGIYTHGSSGTTVSNADFLISRDTRSVYYHYFYFTNPVNCTFSHIEAGAVGDSDFCNSDIFHFNYFISGEPLGGPVTVTDATALDGCFYRFAQCNTQVQAHFVGCSAQLRDQLCLLSNEATASFENCDFLITRGSKQTYGLRCSSASNRIYLKNCRITDRSSGSFFSDGVVAEDCDFDLAVLNVNAYHTVGSVRFDNCRFRADSLARIAPNVPGFRAEYRDCSFSFETPQDCFVQASNQAAILVLGGSVENCGMLCDGKLNDESVLDTNFTPYLFALPEIDVQPESLTAVFGSEAFFHVGAGGENLRYQWQYCKINGNRWTNSGVSAAKTDTLRFTASNQNGYRYRCVVSNPAGSAVSEEAVLTVTEGLPEITLQPESQTVQRGDPVCFSVCASGGALAYQWQYSRDNGETWRNSGAASARTASFAFTAGSQNGYLYRCAVSNSTGGVTSDPAALTVVERKPEILLQPETQTAAKGDTALLAVDASGEGLRFQWQYSKDGGGTWKDSGAVSARTATFAFTVSTQNGYQYRCIVSNSAGSVTSEPAALIVTVEAPVITLHPEDQTVAQGATAAFTVAASGEDLHYQWQYSKDGGGTWKNSGSAEARSAHFSFQASTQNGYQYRCIITNAAGSTASDPAVLRIEQIITDSFP